MYIPDRAKRRYQNLLNGEMYLCSGKSKPDTPDYRGAAEEQAASDMAALEYQTQANRANQNTPWGQVKWAQDPDTGKWTQDTTLTADSQRALDAQLGLSADRSELGQSMMGRVSDEFSNPMDWSGLSEVGSGAGARDRAEADLYKRQTSRLDPQWQQTMEQTEAKLVAQGLRPGDPAYEQQMENLNRAKTDAYDRAQSSAIQMGGAEGSRQYGLESSERNRQLAETMQKRGFSLNEINAIMSGQQVGMPDMPSYSQAGRAAATDYTGAASNQYSASANAASIDNAAMQGLMSGAGSLAMMSDRRLKRNVSKIGMFKQYPMYLFQYIWGQWAVGVMADEVNKDAVTRLPNGYDMVDLARVK